VLALQLFNCICSKEVHIQGLLNLHDNVEEDGGFVVCPGVHKRLLEYTRERKLKQWETMFGKVGLAIVLAAFFSL